MCVSVDLVSPSPSSPSSSSTRQQHSIGHTSSMPIADCSLLARRRSHRPSPIAGVRYANTRFKGPPQTTHEEGDRQPVNPELVPCWSKTKLPAPAFCPGSTRRRRRSVLRTRQLPPATRKGRLDLDRCARLHVLRFDRRSAKLISQWLCKRERVSTRKRSWNAKQMGRRTLL